MTGLKPCYTVNGTDVTCDFTANGFRLPTEAEWEYACRAGTTGDYAGASYNDIAWVNTNSNDIDHNVGLKTANAWGLFDMEGNVWEWCWDWYDPDYYASLASTVTDPRGPATSKAGALRAFRGGSYDAAPIDVRCSRRDGAAPDDLQMNRGFRVVRNK
jgi:formylglycine-generating enzyme required for sulfatase activity